MQLSYPGFVLGFYSAFPACKLQKKKKVLMIIGIIDYLSYFISMKWTFCIICLSREKEDGDKMISTKGESL